MEKEIIGVVGSGAMGSGIAQVAATCGHQVIIFDSNREALQRSKNSLRSTFDKLIEKGKYSAEEANAIQNRMVYADDMDAFSACSLIIEAIIENLEIKKQVFHQLEEIVKADCILASNTSSLSVTSIAGGCKNPGRICGIHFFNPAPLMPLVEIIPAVQTEETTISKAKALIDSWKKLTVIAKDTPGFIVNKVARPYYGEAIRIYEEQLASFAEIDESMRSAGFKMGPFELMDLIGNDINYTVTETVWKQMFLDPRYKPSLTQKRMVEAGRLGRKTGRGYYEYQNATATTATVDPDLKNYIVNRILCMLINEAADAVYYGIASVEDVDTAMTKGVNYPKGLLKWCDEIGVEKIIASLNDLYELYGEDRYRTSVLLKKMSKDNKKFHHE